MLPVNQLINQIFYALIEMFLNKKIFQYVTEYYTLYEAGVIYQTGIIYIVWRFDPMLVYQDNEIVLYVIKST